MKNSFVLIFVCIAGVLYGQRKIAASDFLPPIFYTKQSLIDHYQDPIDYAVVLQNLENKSNVSLKIISKDSNQITYTQTNKESSDTITCVLTFNSNRQLVKWQSNYKNCYDWISSDIPSPVISTIDITYNHKGQIEQKSGHCATSEFSSLTTYYYNRENELDSILLREGYNHPDIYKRIIFVDTTIKSGELKSTMAFILNTPFDYIGWLKEEQHVDTTDFNAQIENTMPRVRRRETIKNYNTESSGSNYVCEFDSLGRITSLQILNSNAGYTLSPAHVCSFCEAACEFPAIFEFYYEKDKIIAVELTSFNESGTTDKSMCRHLVQIQYRREKIKAINFYAGSGWFHWALIKKWSKRKDFQDIEEDVVWQDGPRGLFKRKIR